MSEPAAILATFSDLKLIRGRKVAQLVFEVPIEEAQKATNALGFPNAASEKWCAIALTNLAGGSAPKDSPEGSPSTRAEVPPAKANIHIRRFMALVNDRGFWNYLRRVKGVVVKDEGEASECLRTICGIESRRQLVDDSDPALTLRVLATEFNNWQRGVVVSQCPATSAATQAHGPESKPS